MTTSPHVKSGTPIVVKAPSILEEHAYRDTWGAGDESYLSMMYERLVLMHELLCDDGALRHLHCGSTVTLRLLCDEVFGAGEFRNEIVWRSDARRTASPT